MLKLFTVIVTEGYEAANPKAYRVRAIDADLALAHARMVYSAHAGSKGQVQFVMEGAPVFLPITTSDDFPNAGVIDLGTARFGD